MSEIKEKYMNELLFEETCDTYCNYIENLKDVIDELNNLINELMTENEGYRQSNKRLMKLIEKYEKEME